METLSLVFSTLPGASILTVEIVQKYSKIEILLLILGVSLVGIVNLEKKIKHEVTPVRLSHGGI